MREFNNQNELVLWSLLGVTRFFLSFVVLLSHSVWALPDSPLREWLKTFGAYEAVNGFLIISGFSIARSIATKKTGFYTRRILRIYPMYFVGLTFALIIFIFLGREVEMEGGILLSAGYATYFANYAFLQTFICITASYNTPLWSLSVEFFYYFFAPSFNRASYGVLFSILLVSFAVWVSPLNSYIYGYPALSLGWFWLLGFIIGKNKKNKLLFITEISCLFLFFLTFFSIGLSKTLSVLFIILPLLVFRFSPLVYLPNSFIKLFNYLGRLSYPIYVIHFPVFVLFDALNLSNDLFILVFSVLFFSVISDFIIDDCFNRLFLRPFTFKIIKRLQLRNYVPYL